MGKKKSDHKPPTFSGSMPLIKDGDPEPSYVKKVDDFVERYYNGDYVLDVPRAFSIPFGVEGQISDIGHWMSFLLTEYEISKTKTLQDKYWVAYWLFQLITHAFAVNVIKKGDGVITKLKNCAEEIRQLKETKEKLEHRILELERDNEELQRALDIFGERVTDLDE